MEIHRKESNAPQPCPRGFAASICSRVFKGRKDVVVHLFRPQWEPAEMESVHWADLIQEGPHEPAAGRGDSRAVVLESFTRDELELIVKYLAGRYADRLTHITTTALDFPLPADLLPLSSMPEGKDIGRIRFEIVPGYPLPFAVHGLYDLSQHKPMDQGLNPD